MTAPAHRDTAWWSGWPVIPSGPNVITVSGRTSSSTAHNCATASEWLEEDEPVYVHPRDPYKRVDVLASSRHVRVELDGVTVAESRAPRILFETSLPPRYYLPLSDLRRDLLRASDKRTHCPYKGRSGTG